MRGDFGFLRFALLGFDALVAGMALLSNERSCEAIAEESSGLGSPMNSSAVGKLLLSVDFRFGVYDLDTLLEFGLEIDFDFE